MSWNDYLVSWNQYERDPAVDWVVVARMLAGVEDLGPRPPTWDERLAATRAMPTGSTVYEVSQVCRTNTNAARRLLAEAHAGAREVAA